MPQLFADCLNEVIEYLNDDKYSLHSCLLVNRLWCQVTVGILWRDCNNYSISDYRTLINCLPDESKKILKENGIIISTSHQIFNYAIFCKVLSISKVHEKIFHLLENQYNLLVEDLINYTHIIVQEICKMYMNQTSLKVLEYVQYSDSITYDIYPSPKGFLQNLTKLTFSSNISPELLINLAQTCHNLFLLDVIIIYHIPKELVDLITIQKNLKCFSMMIHDGLKDEIDSIPLLTMELPKTLTRFVVVGENYNISLSFLVNFTNLQELEISFDFSECIESFEKLQDAIFPQLQILIIKYACPRMEFLIKFLKNNGKNLKKIHIDVDDCESEISEDSENSINSLNLTIAKYCPNIRKLSTGFSDKALEMLKILFNNCQYLESIKIWCGGRFLNEKEALEAVLEYSKNIFEIILQYEFDVKFELLPSELESFFIDWKKRIPQKPLSFVIFDSEFCKNGLDKNVENMKIIEKYIKLGVVKNFEIDDYS
ncbi:unnamed protein product [Rhizophagus irregularis]|nr:unnamed protein product [Rhizophagus irregularis]